VLTIVTGVVALGGGIAYAVGPGAPAAGSISAVKVVTEAAQQSYGCIDCSGEIVGAATTISVPSTWSSALILVLFAGDATATSGTMRFFPTIDGAQANPGPVIFAGYATSMDWSLTVGPGTHKIKVMYQFQGNANATIGPWSLTIERAKS
jgi:hypothetical protein